MRHDITKPQNTAEISPEHSPDGDIETGEGLHTFSKVSELQSSGAGCKSTICPHSLHSFPLISAYTYGGF